MADVHGTLTSVARVVVDAAGVIGAALQFKPPEQETWRSRAQLDQLAETVVRPTVEAAGAVLSAGEFLGGAHCQVDLVGIGSCLLLPSEGARPARYWVPSGGDLALPADSDEFSALSQRVANVYARSATLPAWDS